jgi:hippurate hydrolase
VTEKITSAFRSHFGNDIVFDLGHQTASEDFSRIPDAFGTPYTYWGLGGTDPQKYQKALDAGRVEQDIPANHSEYFAPVIEPTLSNGTQAIVVGALTYLAN